MPLDLCRIPQGTALKKSSKFSKFEPQNESPTIIKKKLKKVTKDDSNNKSPKASPKTSPKLGRTDFPKRSDVHLKVLYTDSNHHRMGSGIISGGERIRMLKENLEFQLDEKFDQLKFEIVNESGNVAKFDIYMYGELWHDSAKDGIPGPSAMEALYDIIKKILF